MEFSHCLFIMLAPKTWVVLAISVFVSLTLADLHVTRISTTQMLPHKTMIRKRGMLESVLAGGEFGGKHSQSQASPTSSSTSSNASSTASSSASSSASSTSSSDKHYKGEGTHYQPGLGACGAHSDSSDMVVALSHSKYDAKNNGNPNKNPYCGKKVKVEYENKSVEVKVVDRCEACAENDLDFSPTAFKKLAPLGKGRLKNLKWKFMD